MRCAVPRARRLARDRAAQVVVEPLGALGELPLARACSAPSSSSSRGPCSGPRASPRSRPRRATTSTSVAPRGSRSPRAARSRRTHTRRMRRRGRMRRGRTGTLLAVSESRRKPLSKRLWPSSSGRGGNRCGSLPRTGRAAGRNLEGCRGVDAFLQRLDLADRSGEGQVVLEFRVNRSHRTPHGCTLRGCRGVHLQTRPAEHAQLEFVARAGLSPLASHFDRRLHENSTVCGPQPLERALVDGDTVDSRKEDQVDRQKLRDAVVAVCEHDSGRGNSAIDRSRLQRRHKIRPTRDRHRASAQRRHDRARQRGVRRKAQPRSLKVRPSHERSPHPERYVQIDGGQPERPNTGSIGRRMQNRTRAAEGASVDRRFVHRVERLHVPRRARPAARRRGPGAHASLGRRRHLHLCAAASAVSDHELPRKALDTMCECDDRCRRPRRCPRPPSSKPSELCAQREPSPQR
jgi:hypothetical protein